MTHTLEELQAARDALITARNRIVYLGTLASENDRICNEQTFLPLINEAISKMETTTEQSSEVDDNGMPHEIFANAFGDWMHNPKKDSDPIGFRTTRYTRAEPAQAVVDSLYGANVKKEAAEEIAKMFEKYGHERAAKDIRIYADKWSEKHEYVVDIPDLEKAIELSVLLGYENKKPEGILLEAARAYLTLTKREG